MPKKLTRTALAMRHVGAHKIKYVTSVLALIAALGGAIAAAPHIYTVEPILRFRMESYVGEQLSPFQLAQNQATVAIDRLLRSQLESQLYQAENDPAAKTSPTVQQRVRELKEQIDATDERIKLHGGKR